MLFKANEIARHGCIAIALLLFSFGASAQKTVTGKVTNRTDNSPIANASIQVKGSSVATITNAEGNFSINVPGDTSVLIASFVGYEPVEIETSGLTVVDIPISQLPLALNEVVVTGYSAQRKKDITGAVSVVNVANLKTQPTGTTESLLQGQAAGVTVVNSGAPGGPSNIRVRGITSV